MSRRDRTDEEVARLAREVTERAIRRLDLLQWFVMGGAVVAALAAGGMVGLVANASAGWDVRITWMISSILLFVVLGGVLVVRNRREERDRQERLSLRNEEAHG